MQCSGGGGGSARRGRTSSGGCDSGDDPAGRDFCRGCKAAGNSPGGCASAIGRCSCIAISVQQHRKARKKYVRARHMCHVTSLAYPRPLADVSSFVRRDVEQFIRSAKFVWGVRMTTPWPPPASVMRPSRLPTPQPLTARTGRLLLRQPRRHVLWGVCPGAHRRTAWGRRPRRRRAVRPPPARAQPPGLPAPPPAPQAARTSSPPPWRGGRPAGPSRPALHLVPRASPSPAPPPSTPSSFQEQPVPSPPPPRVYRRARAGPELRRHATGQPRRHPPLLGRSLPAYLLTYLSVK